MYNAKIIKYPDGCHVRLYSSPVGVCFEKEPKQISDLDCTLVAEENEDGEICYYMMPDTVWQNPFTGSWESPPKVIMEQNHERSVKNSMARTVSKIYDMARSNVWDWFITLTYDPKYLDSHDYNLCVKHLSKWLNNMRRYAPDLKYLVIPEQHKSGAFHFHGLLADCGNLVFIDSGHKTKDGEPIYNLGNYRAGFTTATRVTSNERITKYVTKYITKDLCAVAFGRKRYWASRNLNQAEVVSYLLDADQIQALRQELEGHIKYARSSDSPDLKTEYLETDVKPEDGCIGYIAI